jgi:uncharacterized protein YdhG (YjbR/CyaY superfamily)
MVSNPSRDIDEYIARYPADVQETLQKLRTAIREAAPEAEEAISYQIPTFCWHGNLVHFAAYKKHVGFYPTPSGIEHFRDELSGFKLSKGTVQFPLDQPIPFDLVTRIVKFRVQENRERAVAKAAGKRATNA